MIKGDIYIYMKNKWHKYHYVIVNALTGENLIKGVTITTRSAARMFKQHIKNTNPEQNPRIDRIQHNIR